jgi:dolichyl-diphosphooligosaccharide--protein glycosyltransferase
MIIYGIHPLRCENMAKKEKKADNEGSKESGRKGRLKMKKEAKEPKEIKEKVRGRRRARRQKGRGFAQEREEEEFEKSQSRLWLEQNWKYMTILFLIFIFGLFLRSYYYYTPATQDGFILSGNDPYYHKRVVDYVQDTGSHITWDPLLSYPDGALNPRPPLFDWSIAILGLVLSPFFGGNTTVSTWQVMEFAPAFWGALTAIPVYLIGKEMFNKKVGLICAFLLATMPSHVERSPLGFSDHDAIVLFFVTLAFFFFIKALNQLKIRDKWVEDWTKPRDIPKGFKEWFKHNQVSVAFSLLTGLSLATVALIWKGFLYAVVIIIVYFFIQIILNKFRNKDSLGVALCTIIAIAVVAFLPWPYYNGNGLGNVLIPASEILIAVIVVSAILIPTRDSPWLLVFSILTVVLVSGFILIAYVFPDIGSTYFSGQGYFGENKIFSTIAEAQAPDYSRAMFSYGVVTSFLALFGIFLSIIRVAKDLKAHYLFMTIWGVTGLYMAISATRFIFNAGPIFAILSGWIVYELIVKLDFKRMMKHYRSLKGGGRYYGLKKSVKLRHIVGVLFLVFMILIPNVWLGWDAGVPFGEKKEVDLAVYDALPFFMKPQEPGPDSEGVTYNRTNANDLKYFGAFGHGFPSDYWLDSMDWLSEQDNELPVEDRPAFISWWDYGFWSIQLGDHPTAADNFQGRVHYAGSFISAKNESQGQALLIARILEADRSDYKIKEGHGEYKLHDEVRNSLVKYFGEEKTLEIEDVLYNPTEYKTEVLENPDIYGYYSEDLTPAFTPIYAVLQAWIPELLTDDEMTWLLHEIQEETGYSLRYFAIDSRLFPFGPQNTGIYYAPLKLSDHRISENNEPYDFVETFIVASNGREYSLEDFRDAQEKDPKLTADDFVLRYYEPFLESMLMKCYIGYTLEDIGVADSAQSTTRPNLPALHSQNYPAMQAWMMKHFQLVYRTAYYNPYNQTEYQDHQDAWEAMLDTKANELIELLENDGLDNDNNGQVDDRGEGGVITSGLRSGVVYIKYYEGAYLNGTITSTLGSPAPGVRVTVSDEYGIPHDSVFTDENGTYHLIAPSGNVTVSASTGGFGEDDNRAFGILSQQEKINLNRTNIEISDDQVMRREIDEDGDGIWDYYITHDFEIEPNRMEGKIFWDLDSNNEFNKGIDENISLANVFLFNNKNDLEYVSETDSNGTYIFEDLTPGSYEITVNSEGHNMSIQLSQELILAQGSDEGMAFGIIPAELFGNISSIEGVRFVSEEINLLDNTNETILTAITDSDGNFSFKRLLPGNYTLSTEIDGYEDYEKTIAIAQGNRTGEVIVLWPSTKVHGEVINPLDLTPIVNTSIKFEGLEDLQGIIRFIQTDSDGLYSLALRNGKYKIQVKHYSGDETPLVFLDEIEILGGDLNLNISLQESIEVYGTVFRDFDENGSIEPIETRPYADVIFESSSWKVEVKTNFTGFYRVFLPADDYIVYATYPAAIDSFIGDISVTGSNRIEYNIALLVGRRMVGNVYHDIDESGTRDPFEGLSYATLTFTDTNGTIVKEVTDLTGSYSIILPIGRNFTVLVQREGYDDYFVGPLNLSDLQEQKDLELNPVEIMVSGVTQYESTPVANISISFEAVSGSTGENKTTQSDASGDFSVALLPGEYRVFADNNTSEAGKPVRYLIDETITIEVAEGTRDYTIDLSKLITINGTINGTSENVTIKFEALNTESPELKNVTTVNGTFDFFITPGEYQVSVDHEANASTHYIYLAAHNLTESETIILNLSLGVEISGIIRYEGTPISDIEITFTNSSEWVTQTNGAGSYSMFLLPNQTYELTINQTQPESGKQVKFTYNDTISMNATPVSDYDINLTKYIKVNGVVYLDWNGDDVMDSSEVLDNITISFENLPDIFQVMTNESGGYELFLEVDENYEVNLSSDFPIKTEGLFRTPTMTNNEFDFEITPENLTLLGSTKKDGVPRDFTALWFTKKSSIAMDLTTASDSNGEFSINLSYGIYDLYARKVSGSDVYAYLGEITIRPRESLQLDVLLETALRVKGKAYIINSTGQNLSIAVGIEFTDVAKIVTDSDINGLFEVWLPSGSYKTIANFTTSEYDMTMEYTHDKLLDILQDTTLYLNLTKDLERE